MARSNIIIFGESGAGKSSVINMLSANENSADISAGARGCTFEARSYDVDVLGQPATLWDTAGLDEGDAGRVPKAEAIVQLYTLLRKLSDGVSLLMFVMRAPRVKASAPQNWKLFREVICQKKVPIAIVITGLEQEDNMDAWWWNNKATFQNYDIYPGGFACITATRGKARRGGGHIFDDEYDDSRGRVRQLIRATSLATPWRVPAAEWFKTIVHTTYSTKSLDPCGIFTKTIEHKEYQEVAGDALHKLIHTCGMPEEVAKDLAQKLKGK
ncbi:hypothetical protein NP233_g6812 [Leucocoprinus birnbaumii]|uniref:G domain-containing protein n=1 Tax=Leucocoprinus birnbaumii TaxID=56174 RepID=A0AAD5YVE4_9AGAR|nr:hypothetical protein NP233_g6812 [Leucocoprinus birnbaumii]